MAKEELENENVEMKKQLTKAKELIKEMLSILPKENIEGVYEITEEAEQFLRELEEQLCLKKKQRNIRKILASAALEINSNIVI